MLESSSSTPKQEYDADLMKIKRDLQVALIHALNKPISIGAPGAEEPGPWLTEGYSQKLRNFFEQDQQFQQYVLAWHADQTPEALARLVTYFPEALH